MEIVVTVHKPNNFKSLISLVANIKEKNDSTMKEHYSLLFFRLLTTDGGEYYASYSPRKPS